MANDSKLFVGNLDWDVTDSDLEEAFSAHGTVESANVVTERGSDRSRGFGFVEFSSAEEAQAAQEALDGTELKGRSIRVNPAKPKN